MIYTYVVVSAPAAGYYSLGVAYFKMLGGQWRSDSGA